MIENKDSIIIGVRLVDFFFSHYIYDLRFNRKMDAINSIVSQISCSVQFLDYNILLKDIEFYYSINDFTTISYKIIFMSYIDVMLYLSTKRMHWILSIQIKKTYLIMIQKSKLSKVAINQTNKSKCQNSLMSQS